MSNFNLIKLLKKNTYIYKGTRIQRLRKAPKKILYSKILEFVALWLKNPIRIKTKTFWNEKMTILIPEELSLSLCKYGFYEEGLTRMVLEYLKLGMIFFDIGAHFGYYTLLGSILVGNEGQVHSFEPTLSTFDILKINVSNKHNIFLNNLAVLSKKKNVLINDCGTKYSMYNSIYNRRLVQDVHQKLEIKKYEVKSISIDDYVECNGIIPNFIKIDAESSEYEILLGMKKTIAKFQPMISIEVGDKDIKGVPTSKNLINFLVNRSYQPYEFKNGKILQHLLKNEQYRYDNILFLPNSPSFLNLLKSKEQINQIKI